MKVTKEDIGNIVCLKNQTTTAGLHVTGKILQFHKGANFTDVDLELPNGNVINTFANNIEESGLIDFMKHEVSKGIIGLIKKAA